MKRYTYKHIRQVMEQCRDASARMAEQVKKMAAEGHAAPTSYELKAELLQDIFSTHEEIMEQLMDEIRRLKREARGTGNDT